MIRGNIECALGAGLSMILPIYFLSKWEVEYYGTASFLGSADIIKLVLIQGAYFAAAFLIWLLRKHYLARKVPSWILISITGSLFFTITYSVAQLTLTNITPYKLKIAFLTLLVFIGYTLPFTALAYYVRKWHTDSEPAPSVLGVKRAT